MKNYIAATTISFEGSGFYVRPGDLLTHGAQHGNSLAVYRNGHLDKVLAVDSLVIEAFLKSRFITEVKRQPAKKPTTIQIAPKPADTEAITPEVLADAYVKTLLVNDLENTPATQADMNALAKQHDELMGQPPKPEKRRKSKPAAEIDFAVHPPVPPLSPSQVIGLDEPEDEPLRNRIDT